MCAHLIIPYTRYGTETIWKCGYRPTVVPDEWHRKLNHLGWYCSLLAYVRRFGHSNNNAAFISADLLGSCYLTTYSLLCSLNKNVIHQNSLMPLALDCTHRKSATKPKANIQYFKLSVEIQLHSLLLGQLTLGRFCLVDCLRPVSLASRRVSCPSIFLPRQLEMDFPLGASVQDQPCSGSFGPPPTPCSPQPEWQHSWDSGNSTHSLPCVPWPSALATSPRHFLQEHHPSSMCIDSRPLDALCIAGRWRMS